MFVSATTMLIPLVRKFGNYESDKMRVEMLNDEKGNEAMDLISTLAIENHNKACDVGRSMLRMSISPENNLPTLSEDRLSILASGPPSLPPSPAVSKSTTAHYFLDGSGVPPLPPPSTTHLDLQNETEFQKPPKTYEGWLYKGSGKGFGYKKRYFVLSENQFCYRNEKNNGVSTRCFLKMAILNPLPEDFPSKTTTEFKFRVQIQQKKKKKSSTRMFYLCADTQIELDVWLFKFQEHIAYANMSSMKGSPLPPSATYLLHCFSSDDEDNTDSQKIPKPTEGWLYKSNGKGSVYKKRYIVLSKNQFYYRNKQKKDGISTRCFLKMAILNPLPEDFPSKPKTEFKFRVQIQVIKKKSTSTRIHFLCADTQEELDVWLSKFQEHIAYANRSAVPTDQPSQNGPPLPAPTEINKSLSSTETVDELFSSVMLQAQSLLGADRSTLFIVDKKNKELWTRIATEIEPIRIPMNAGIVGQCVVKNTPLRIGDAYQCEYFNQAVDQKTGYKTTSVLAMPVCNTDGKVLGALQVINKIQDTDSNQIDVFNEDDEELLAHLCGHIAVAIERCEENESGQPIDEYTMSEGINYLQALEKQLASMKRSRPPPSSTTPLDIHSGISDIPKIPKTYEGWLYESNGNWLVGYKKRYFVLSENQFVFRNKQKQGGVSTRCFLKLAILNPLPEKFPSKPKTEFKFRVQITVKKKKKTKTTMHYLCADTQEELDVWLSKFQEHIAYANRSAVPTDQPSMNGPPLPAPTTTHPGQYDAAKKMRLARLVGMTKSLSSTESIDELFSSVMSEAQSLLGADRSTKKKFTEGCQLLTLKLLRKRCLSNLSRFWETNRLKRQ